MVGGSTIFPTCFMSIIKYFVPKKNTNKGKLIFSLMFVYKYFGNLSCLKYNISR